MARQPSDEITAIGVHLSATSPEEGKTKIAHLVVLSGSNVGQVFPLDGTDISVGRAEGAGVQIMDAGISRQHATVSRDLAGNFYIQDAGSRNGTFVNNVRVNDIQALEDGDKIQVGVMTILKFSYADSAEASYATSMYQAALRDGLTGIFNRRYFEDRLRNECAFAIRHGNALALLVLDLDHFKQVNDTLGHLAGDEVLKEFAKVVARVIRAEDVLARYGGEEFVILCRDTDLIRASVLAERVRHEVAGTVFCPETHRVKLTVSIGMAALPDTTVNEFSDLFVAADEALYQAKERGRNCVVARRSKK